MVFKESYVTDTGDFFAIVNLFLCKSDWSFLRGSSTYYLPGIYLLISYGNYKQLDIFV